jgi:hypothetical protein
MSHSITMNGIGVAVTENLWEALKHLRLRNADRILWVDALCICQINPQERTEQVSNMATIYSSATRVISWLGLVMEDVVQSAMVTLMELFTAAPSQEAGEAKQNESMPHKELLGKLNELPAEIPNYKKLKNVRHPQVAWRNMRSFFSQRYWKRVWIIQEVVLAKELLLQCGECFIDGKILSQFLKLLRHAGSSDQNELPLSILELGLTPAAKVLYYKIDRVVDRDLVSNRSSRERGFGLVESLVNFMHSRCGDPRDKVYGFLGISDDAKNLQPNYHLTPLRLYDMVISIPDFRSDDGLVSLSQLLQQLMGGLIHPRNEMLRGVDLSGDDRQLHGTFYTRAVICGSISVIGDSFTTSRDARKLLVDWHSLYFHRIQLHHPGDELPSGMDRTITEIEKYAKRAVAIDSRVSYSYIGVEHAEEPGWDEVKSRYTDGVEGPTMYQEGIAGDVAGVRDGLAIPQNDKTTGAEPKQDDICGKMMQAGRSCEGAEHELCQCLRTTKLAGVPKWAIGSRGQICLVPGNAQEGDIICHFQRTDVAALVRPFGNTGYHSVIGSALVLRQWDELAEKIHPRATEEFKYSTGTRRRDFANFREDSDQMSFHLDRACLRMLSCPASEVVHLRDVDVSRPAPAEDHYMAARRLLRTPSDQGPPRRVWADPSELSFATQNDGALPRPDLPHLRSGKVKWEMPTKITGYSGDKT